MYCPNLQYFSNTSSAQVFKCLTADNALYISPSSSGGIFHAEFPLIHPNIRGIPRLSDKNFTKIRRWAVKLVERRDQVNLQTTVTAGLLPMHQISQTRWLQVHQLPTTRQKILLTQEWTSGSLAPNIRLQQKIRLLGTVLS
ncbi:hypothetical protein RRG08_025596 [Elysia crispata]|uniref:Uncharacterized protein n=1 Tax=Elysia crispata TaxID=231223 RepID=A0AAE0YE02_9GAST|nr:hypothetical protein RRG08_025596 [Elysia crispata]